MKLKFLFAWYDLWVGLFWDKIKAKLYIMPLPTIGLVLELLPPGYSIKKTISHWSPGIYTEKGGDLPTYILYNEINDQVGAFLNYRQAIKHANKIYKILNH